MNHQDAQERAKQQAALAAIEFIQDDMIVGVGTGSTVAYFITALQKVKHKIQGVVASSASTSKQLKTLGLDQLDLNAVSEVSLYVDGADEVNPSKQLLKGAGGALTSEKIIATVAKQFICIVDECKLVAHLGMADCPIAIEVIPMARGYVARQLLAFGADPVYRQGVITDHGNIILDAYHFPLKAPVACEEQLNHLVGVVESGIFAKRPADVVLIGDLQGKIEQR